MKYNFDKPVNRYGTNSYKYDAIPLTPDQLRDSPFGGRGATIALWVADMDFETAPVIQRAVKARMEHGCFGYTMVPESYYDANISWFGNRHGWQPQRDSFIYTSGVVPAVSAIIKAIKNYVPGATADDLVTEQNDYPSTVKVLLQTPAYNCFFSCIRNNNCVIEENPLIYDNANATYTIDWDDFESKCADPDVRIFILCNPHNPSGRVWTSDELRRMADICKRNNVFVIADEIHCEFVNPYLGREYVPFATVADIGKDSLPLTNGAGWACCVSPSKAFNIAGLQIANIIVPDADVRARIDKAININEVCDVNPFGVLALQAAYTAEGAEWLDQLNDYIYANYDFAKTYMADNLPMMKVTPLEGTYLMWVNISAYGMSSDQFAQYILDNANVYVNAGMMYGDTTGHDFIRVNIATQRSRLAEGLQRIKTALQAL